MAYADLNTIQTTDPGDPLSAAWCDQVRDNDEFFRDPPACSVYNSAAVASADNVPILLLANSETYDNDSMHSTSSNTHRLTCQTPGRYLLTASVSWATNATSNRAIEFSVNGSTLPGGTLLPSSGSTNSTALVLTRTLVLAANDWVAVLATQRSGGNLNVTLSEFAAVLLTLT